MVQVALGMIGTLLYEPGVGYCTYLFFWEDTAV